MTEEQLQNRGKSPSEDFLLACEHVTGSGGCRRNCSCGITTYNPDGTWDWEEGELEALRKDKNAIEVDYSVPSVEIDGKEFVVGCPCNGLYKYEGFIWANRELIVQYLRLRAKTMNKMAEKEINLTDSLPAVTGTDRWDLI